MDHQNRHSFQKTEEHFDKKYAIKLVEKIVFGMVAIILTAFVIAVVNNVTK
ncbi:MAG: hypothetical protein WA082_04485 [Candidatus Moraniibacteriota bacterium]